MDRKIVTYGGYFERFMRGLTEKEQQKIKYGLLLLKSQDKISKIYPRRNIRIADFIQWQYLSGVLHL